MYFKKEQTEQGAYLNIETQTRYELGMCRRITTNAGVDVGWTEFESVSACLENWQLEYKPTIEITE